MSVTMEEMDAKIEAAEARTDAKFERMLNVVRSEIQDLRGEVKADIQKLRGEMHDLQGEMHHLRSDMTVSTARQRVWFMIMAVSIVISTVSILEFLGSTGSRSQQPIIINVPAAVSSERR